ncbi:MAG: hypothetical protein KDA42_04975 [Planctomycetales bacterium]|nr:hypothetical protein [Planctomycetales bacterium]
MLERKAFSAFAAAFTSAALLVTSSQAAKPSEELLPLTTKGYVSVPDVQQFDTSWEKTQLGQLAADPVMKPFADDIRAQLKKKWGAEYEGLGLTFDDLKGVPGGEVAIARIRPDSSRSAVAVLVDVTDHLPQANELLEKIDASMTEKKATKAVKDVLGSQVTTYTLPLAEGEKSPRQAVFFINDNVLCGVDDAEIANEILGRFSGEPIDNLAHLPAYRAVMSRAASEAGELAPELRWFLEPFGYVEAVRHRSQQERGKDMLKILQSQGFEAVQGIGGFVNMYVEGKYELLHRTMIYAPQDKDAKPGDKYQLAARMLDFPNQGDLLPQPWVPRGLATYVSFNWETRKAFESVGTLVDAIVGEEGVFEEIIASLHDDENGPQIDLRNDLVAHLGTRCTVFSDYELPISPKCERMVFAVETTNAEALAATISKAMNNDPDARELKFEGYQIWEIIDQEEELPTVEIELPTFGAQPEEKKEEKKKLPNSAVCVAHGQFFIATHVEFLKKVLVSTKDREKLANSYDFQLVMKEVDALAAGENCSRIFSRTDEEYRPTYELIRAGRMPEAETMLGKILNGLLGEGKEGELRQQRIDGHSLPDFEMVRRYLGPAGIAIHAEENGWFVQGVTLSKETP